MNQYWREKAETFKWQKDFKTVQSGGFIKGDVKWFEEGELNLCENLLDRNISNGLGESVAIHWEANESNETSKSYTYIESLKEVSKFSNALKKSGVKKGDVVAFYMPMVPEAFFALLACSRIGAVHTVIFGGFSEEALRSRLEDSKAKVLVTAHVAKRGAKNIDLLSIAEASIENLKSLETLVVVENGKNKSSDPRAVGYSKFVEGQSDQSEPISVSSEDPLFILYTSGSTGKPKGLVHTTAGYMVWAAHTFSEVFNYNSQKGDVFWCTADIGWITGHTYFLYGPLLNGATQVMFEGVPTYPDKGRFWAVIDKYKVSHFYTAPTAIRALQACGNEWVEKHDLSSLKVLGTVGEPINVEAWEWYNKVVGKNKCEIVDTWWQTETGGVMISNRAGQTKPKPTYATKPLPGVEPVLLTTEGELISENEKEGVLCIKEPWPGVARTILNDHQRYLETYMTAFKGHYFTGDGAKRDSEGDYRIIGRIDDVVNVSGHRIGTAEVEDVINKSGLVLESAVVGAPDEITGQALAAFAIVGESASKKEDLLKNINLELRKKVGAFAKVKNLYLVSDLPKTRSGKIMRRLLRKIVSGDSNFGDTSTLLNPECLEDIKKAVQ
jgi:acetyl-CoA synthetase